MQKATSCRHLLIFGIKLLLQKFDANLAISNYFSIPLRVRDSGVLLYNVVWTQRRQNGRTEHYTIFFPPHLRFHAALSCRPLAVFPEGWGIRLSIRLRHVGHWFEQVVTPNKPWIPQRVWFYQLHNESDGPFHSWYGPKGFSRKPTGRLSADSRLTGQPTVGRQPTDNQPTVGR